LPLSYVPFNVDRLHFYVPINANIAQNNELIILFKPEYEVVFKDFYGVGMRTAERGV
jgi:hypothetical protein